MFLGTVDRVVLGNCYNLSSKKFPRRGNEIKSVSKTSCYYRPKAFLTFAFIPFLYNTAYRAFIFILDDWVNIFTDG